MSVQLNDETQKLIEARMELSGFDNADELVRLALQTLETVQGEDFDELDADTRAAIDRGEAEYERGEGRPWEEVKDELLKRFAKH